MKTSCRHAALSAALLTLLAASFARAEESEPSLFVQPHTGMYLRIQESNASAVARFAHKTPEGFRLDLSVSAPLDDQTHEAALASLSDGPASGASARLALGYDSRQPALALTPFEADISAYRAACVFVQGTGKKSCQLSEGELIQFYRKHAAQRGSKVDLGCEKPPVPGESAESRTAREGAVNDCRNAEAYINFGQHCPPTENQGNLCEGMVRALGRLDAAARGPKEMERNAIPAQSAFYYALLLESAGHYDRASAYQVGNVAAPIEHVSSYGMSLGGRLDLYFAPSWAFSLGAGWDLDHDPALVPFRRCTALDSEDASVTGQACSDVKALASDPESESSVYARVAGMYLFRDLIDGAVPGLEARFSVSGIGQTPEWKTRLTAFISPVVGPALSRFGFGVDFSGPFQSDADAGTKAGELRNIAPFLLVGASL